MSDPLPDILESIIDESQKRMAKAADNAMHRVFPKKASASYERFRAVVWELILKNPALKECSLSSKLVAAHVCAKLGLVPDPTLGNVYILPRKIKGVAEACVQIGYRGILALAYRSRVVKSIRAYPVFENDHFVFEEGLNPKLEHKPYDLIGKTAPADYDTSTVWHKGVIAAYAVAELDSGGTVFRVVTRREIATAMQASPSGSGSFSPWKSNFPEMAAKTALHRLGKLLPLSAEDPELSVAIDAQDRAEAGISLDVPQEYIEAGIVETPSEAEEQSPLAGKPWIISQLTKIGANVSDFAALAGQLFGVNNYERATMDQASAIILKLQLDAEQVEVPAGAEAREQ